MICALVCECVHLCNLCLISCAKCRIRDEFFLFEQCAVLVYLYAVAESACRLNALVLHYKFKLSLLAWSRVYRAEVCVTYRQVNLCLLARCCWCDCA